MPDLICKFLDYLENRKINKETINGITNIISKELHIDQHDLSYNAVHDILEDCFYIYLSSLDNPDDFLDFAELQEEKESKIDSLYFYIIMLKHASTYRMLEKMHKKDKKETLPKENDFILCDRCKYSEICDALETCVFDSEYEPDTEEKDAADDDTEENDQVIIYTCGICDKDTGKGAFCTYVRSELFTGDIIIGDDKYTTANRINLISILNGLESLKEKDLPDDCKVIIVITAKGLWNYFTTDRIAEWLKNNWTTPDGRYDLPNADLWKRIFAEAAQYNAIFMFGDPDKEYDFLSSEKIKTCFDIAGKILKEEYAD